MSATTSSRCGANSAKLDSCFASSQRTSAIDVARARRVTSDTGVAIARSRSRRISRRFASCQSSSCAAPACARSISRDTFGEVSSTWHSDSSAASCSPRTLALPRGIITAASQRSRLAAPRKACRRLNSCSSCWYGEAAMAGGAPQSVAAALRDMAARSDSRRRVMVIGEAVLRATSV